MKRKMSLTVVVEGLELGVARPLTFESVGMVVVRKDQSSRRWPKMSNVKERSIHRGRARRF
jgi:hypothetical protein